MPRALACRRSALPRLASSSCRSRYVVAPPSLERRSASANGMTEGMVAALTSMRVRWEIDDSMSPSNASSHARSPAEASMSSMHTRPPWPSPRTASTRCETHSRIGANAMESPSRLAAAHAASSRWDFPEPASPTISTRSGDGSEATRRTASTSSAFSGVTSKFANRRPRESARCRGIWAPECADFGAGSPHECPSRRITAAAATPVRRPRSPRPRPASTRARPARAAR